MYFTVVHFLFFFFSSRRRHTRLQGDWSSDVCSSDLPESIARARQLALRCCRVAPAVQFCRARPIRECRLAASRQPGAPKTLPPGSLWEIRRFHPGNRLRKRVRKCRLRAIFRKSYPATANREERLEMRGLTCRSCPEGFHATVRRQRSRR